MLVQWKSMILHGVWSKLVYSEAKSSLDLSAILQPPSSRQLTVIYPTSIYNQHLPTKGTTEWNQSLPVT